LFFFVFVTRKGDLLFFGFRLFKRHVLPIRLVQSGIEIYLPFANPMMRTANLTPLVEDLDPKRMTSLQSVYDRIVILFN
jgi:hypothetical protein